MWCEKIVYAHVHLKYMYKTFIFFFFLHIIKCNIKWPCSSPEAVMLWDLTDKSKTNKLLTNIISCKCGGPRSRIIMTVSKCQEASLKATVSDDEEGENNDKNDDNSGDGNDDSDKISFRQFHIGILCLCYHLCNGNKITLLWKRSTRTS